MRNGLIDRVEELYENESGATMVEYALVAALIVMASVLVISELKQTMTDSFKQQKNYFEGGK